MRKQIHPAIEKLGITKRIGWHTVRSRVPSLPCAKCLPSRGKSNRNDRLQVHVSGDACGIRSRLPEDSGDGYTPAEIAALERKSSSAQRFAPY
jgi:hypothetical protein